MGQKTRKSMKGFHIGKGINVLPDRITRAISIEKSGCWTWMLSKNDGYGRPMIYGKKTYIHRLTYEAVYGEIPEGMEIDHVCQNKACCNPSHLEPVTHRENVQRYHKSNKKSHCKRGHEFTESNTHVNPQNKRICKICRDAYRKEWRARC